MKYFYIFTACIFLQLLFVSVGWAHGTQGDVVQSEGYLITAEYDDGEPMNYAEIKIKAPGSNVPFQTGRTDLLGHFLVKPNIPGNWEVEVLDGMGHRLALAFTVDENLKGDTADNKDSPITADIKPLWKAVVGVSIIFGVFGILFGLRANHLNSVPHGGKGRIRPE